ncbi:hypothetical protein LCGC14_0632640 [marine sediment metagenome]|uniref:Uncharacterized protein n=1 Tax=marine sediment metagenome TaxID=412755 RepID=A0A0F9R6R7_9ZZZZ
MEYNKETDQWIGTPKEHLVKLLETHDCMCEKVRMVLQGLIDEKEVIREVNERGNIK